MWMGEIQSGSSDLTDDKEGEERARGRSTLTRELEGEGGDGCGMGLALATLQTKHTIGQGGKEWTEREYRTWYTRLS